LSFAAEVGAGETAAGASVTTDVRSGVTAVRVLPGRCFDAHCCINREAAAVFPITLPGPDPKRCMPATIRAVSRCFVDA